MKDRRDSPELRNGQRVNQSICGGGGRRSSSGALLHLATHHSPHYFIRTSRCSLSLTPHLILKTITSITIITITTTLSSHHFLFISFLPVTILVTMLFSIPHTTHDTFSYHHHHHLQSPFSLHTILTGHHSFPYH